MKIHKAGNFAKLHDVGHPAFSALFYVEKGRIRVRLGDAVYQIMAGEVFCLLPGTFGEMVGDGSSALGGYILLEDALPFAENTTLYPDESGKKMLRAMLSERKGDEALFRHLHEAPAEGERVLRRRIQVYVKENLHKKLSLTSAAEDLGVSAQKLSALAKEAFGCRFGAYVSRERLMAAKHLLQNKTLKISDITKRLGFSSVQYFSISFKKETGMTPSDFRKYFKI